LNFSTLILAIIGIVSLIMEGCIHRKRVLTELKILINHPDVRSYFYYESSGRDEESKRFCIYGYLLPRTELYKNGAYKVRITLPTEFPFRSPVLELLTYIYHPAVDNDISQPRFCNKCARVTWTLGTRISRWLEQYVNIIERPDVRHGMCCVGNTEAEELYHQNRDEYDKKALAMVNKYSHVRPYRSILSLKFVTKQTICKHLDFQSAKIDQLPLCTSLKQYLNSSLHKSQDDLKH
jgi:ubiquitin-conjugating enzyme E2 D/E